jgi:acylphosphatase
MLKNYQITIEGRVQGVGFRYWVKGIAEISSITGFVKNLPDGKVYVEIETSEETAKNFIGLCHEGPPLARVRKLTFIESGLKGYHDFRVH